MEAVNTDLAPLVNVVQPDLCRVAMGLASHIHKKVNKISGPHSVFVMGREIQSEVCEYTIKVGENETQRLIAIYMHGIDWVFHCESTYDYIRTVFDGDMTKFSHDLTAARIVLSFAIGQFTDERYNEVISDFDYDLPKKSMIPLGNSDNVYYDGSSRIV